MIPRSTATRIVPGCLTLALALAVIANPGCGPAQPVNTPEMYNFGALEEVGDIYRSASSAKKSAPASLKDLAGGRDNFLLGYKAIESGEIILFWNTPVLPGDQATEEILAYKADVPEKGGPVLLTNGTTKTLTAEQFKAAPKPKGPASK